MQRNPLAGGDRFERHGNVIALAQAACRCSLKAWQNAIQERHRFVHRFGGFAGQQEVFEQRVEGKARRGIAIEQLLLFRAIGQLRNWLAGALVLGLVVSAVMNFIITLETGTPWGPAFVEGLITNVVFYATPVALILARAARRA